MSGADSSENGGQPEGSALVAWCRLVGIERLGLKVGVARVVAVDTEAVAFQVMPPPAPPLRIGCRPAGHGLAFCTTARFGLFYFSDGGRKLASLEERFLYALCMLTRRAELKEK